MKRILILFSLLLVSLPISAFSTPFVIDSLSTAEVGSDEMQGISITVYFEGGSSETGIWGDSGASGTDWSLNFLGANTSTFANDWRLYSSSDINIDKFSIDTLPGNVVFDIIYSVKPDNGSTEGSESGFWAPNLDTTNDNTETGPTSASKAFATSGTSGPDLLDYHGYFVANNSENYGTEFYWEFSNPVYLKGASSYHDPPTGPHDLFSTLLIDFTDSPGHSGDFYFGVDTDTFTGGYFVPEPSTFLLFGVGLLGLGALGRRR